MTSVRENRSGEVEKRGGGSSRREWTRADFACVLAIALLSTLFFLPTMSRPLSSSHDAKAGLIVRQMLERKVWFVADVEVGPVNKPPVYYWFAAGLSALVGEVNEWTVRLPSLAGCVATALMTWVLARELWDRWTGLVSATVLVTLAQFHLLAQTAKLDSPVTLSVVAAVFCFWKALGAAGGAWNARSWSWSSAGYLSLAAGAAVKGPVGVVLTALTLLPLLLVRWTGGERHPLHDIVRLHPVSGAVILLAVVAPVFYGMDRASSGRFLHYFVLHENLARAGLQFADAEEFRRSYSFFHYFGTIWFVAAPWSVFLPTALVLSTRRQKNSSHAAALLVLFYFVLPFLFLSAVSVKKWSYLMPVCPAVAMLCGKLWTDLMRGEFRENLLAKWSLALTSAALVLAAIAVSLAAVWLAASGLVGWASPTGFVQRPTDPELVALGDLGFLKGAMPVIVLMAVLVLSAWFIRQQRFRTAFALILVVAVAGTLFHDFLIEPRCVPMYSQRAFTRRVERWLAEHEGSAASPLYVCAGEPYEFLFYFNGRTRVIADPDADDFLSRIRPADSPGPGMPVEVILSRHAFEQVRMKAGPQPELLSTAERESISAPLILTTVKLTGGP